MRVPSSWSLALAIAALGLAACTGTVTTPSTAPPLVPTPVPEYQMQGKSVQVYTYRYGFPSPQPPAVIRTKIKQDVQVLETSAPLGLPQQSTHDVQAVNTESTNLETTQTHTDTYVASKGGRTLEYADTWALEAPIEGEFSSRTTIWGTPQILTGSGRWTNSPASVIHENYSDGHYEDRTYAADGTYEEKGSTYSVRGKYVPIRIVEDATGAGTYQGPFVGCPPQTAFHFTAPSGSPATIALSLTSPSSNCRIPSTPLLAWYPASPKFYREQDAGRSGKVPAGCGKFAGTTARFAAHAVVRLDTIIGYTEATARVAYYDAMGPICIAYADHISNYYDWQGDTPGFITVAPDAKPVSTIDTAEFLVRTHASNGAAPFADAIVASANAQFVARMDRVRAEALRAMILRSASKGGTR